MQDISSAQIALNMPVTHLLSIDGETTRDIDDAMWISRTDDGYAVDVYISNVSKHVPKDSRLDAKARHNAFSIYRGARGCIRPMIHRDLSEGALSLAENEPRDALGIHLALCRNLSVTSVSFSRPTVMNQNCLTHAMADSIIKSEDDSDVKASLSLMMDVARGLLNLRRAAGALAFYDVAKGIMVNEDGQLVKVAHEKCFHSQVVVQEFMILANAACAQYCAKHGIPLLYRNHVVAAESPDSAVLADEIAYAIAADDGELIKTLGKRMMRIMTKATIGHDPLGHYALNLPVYAYFTSPIRRYPDLVNHRMLLAHIDGQNPPYTVHDMAELAAEYNEAVVSETDKVAQYHRSKVDRMCARVLDENRLSGLGEAEFYRVIRYLSGADLPLPDNFVTEWCNRLESGAITPRLIAALIGGLGHKMTPPIVRSTLLHLGRNPHLAPSVWDTLANKYGQALPVIKIMERDGKFESSASGEFMGTAILVEHLFEKTKRKAEQAALLGALHSYFNQTECSKNMDNEILLGMNEPLREESKVRPLDSVIGPSQNEASRNYKGEIMELCQKNKWSVPQFNVIISGPDHQRSFMANVSISANGQICSSQGENSSSKKEAERLAARMWLKEHSSLSAEASGSGDITSIAPHQNPINRIQEIYQKGLASSPVYQISPKASIFECNVSIEQNDETLSASALGSTKKEAKAKAAASLLEKLLS